MKTTNNAQKTVNGQIRKMVLRGAAVIVSLVLISWSVGAQSYLEQVLNGYSYGKMAMTGIEESQEMLEANATINAIEAVHVELNNFTAANFEAIEAELELQVEEYHAADFVETELSIETENWMNTTETNFDAIEAELELQVEEYHAADFIETELSSETENWMNTSTEMNFEAIEETLELQVEVYDAARFVEKELSIETENWMNKSAIENMEAIEAGLANQVKGYDAAKYVEAEFTAEAEAETAKEAELQVE